MRSWLPLAAVCWLVAASAYAEPPSTYDPLIAQALKEYRGGNFGEARVLFQQAHRLYPNARTFRGLAITAFELRMYVEAMAEANAALDSQERPLTDVQREELKAMLVRARSYAARIELDLTPRGAAVEIDGHVAERSSDGTYLVDPGEHTVAVRASGQASQTRQVQVESGQRQKLVFVLAATDAPAQASSAGTAAPVPQTVDARAPAAVDGGSVGPWFWVAAGGAVAFSGAAIALHLIALGEASEIERDCPIEPERVCTGPELDRRIDDAGIETLNTLTAVSLVAAGVSAVAAVTLLVVDLDGSDEKRTVSLRVAPTAVDVRVRF